MSASYLALAVQFQQKKKPKITAPTPACLEQSFSKTARRVAYGWEDVTFTLGKSIEETYPLITSIANIECIV